MNTFISILAYLSPYSYEQDMDEDFYNYMVYYSMLAIQFPSPVTRTNGLKIINELATVHY